MKRLVKLACVALVGAILLFYLLAEHAGPWIMPRFITIRVVAGPDRPLSGARIRVLQDVWSIPCLRYMGISGASCASGKWTVFHGHLDRNGEARVLVFQAAGLRADSYIACINGNQYEGYFAYTEWPEQQEVQRLTLDYKRLEQQRTGCMNGYGEEQLAAPAWWDAALKEDADAAVQDDEQQASDPTT
ncbi:hypothetical protein ACP93_16010 [Xanthomonas sp. NCPPB 1128]|uniref:hypothetical protein n=1 Tax=Xanthomonas sp. NCPPB 1128 TaxID=1775876 RepID=UPI00065AB929|nr:hypothetical protein [Xanthomonas sp. NCPPB 1128]KMM74532.1 hypothetical protein ACP93_16010 [Xanthomonas sp. NCPPB 1128]